jgi:hypothetical protein
MNRWRTLRPGLWLAVAVMLLGALAPTVSRALASRAGAAPSAIEVCTSDGPRWLDLRSAPPSDPNVSGTTVPEGQGVVPSMDHCPFCLLVADRLGPPPAASMHFFNAESGLAPPDAQALFFRSISPGSIWPRGPPIHF